jgi:hypothetical protein
VTLNLVELIYVVGRNWNCRKLQSQQAVLSGEKPEPLMVTVTSPLAEEAA